MGLAPGAGGSLTTPGLQSLSEAIAEAGYDCMRFELPYRLAGKKSPPKAESEAPRFTKLFRELSDEIGQGRPWVLGGRSYGGRVASLAVAGDLEAAGLVFYSYPLHRPGDSSKPRADHWPLIRVPCLFLEGTADPFCKLGVLKEHLGRLPGGATLHVVEGGDHALKVAGSRAPDGKPRSEREVCRELGGVVADWLATL